jgi:PAS domain S-box-containing protein
MLQNFEELHAAQDDMAQKQKELQEANEKLKSNESILRKALEKAQEKEKQYEESKKSLEEKLEELKKMQEELESAEEENQAQLAAINKTSILLEMDNNGIILFPNENFCRLLNYSPIDLIGQKHKIVIPEEMSESKEYAGLWEYLKSGNIQVGECQLIRKDKIGIKIQGTYVPVKKRSGVIDKIIFIGTRLSDEAAARDKEVMEVKMASLEEQNKLFAIQLKSAKADYNKQLKALEDEIKRLKNK